MGEREREGGQSTECTVLRRRAFAFGTGNTIGPGSEVRRLFAAGRAPRIGRAPPAFFGKSFQVGTSSTAARRAGVPSILCRPSDYAQACPPQGGQASRPLISAKVFS